MSQRKPVLVHVVQESIIDQNGAVVQQSSSDAVYLSPLALNGIKKSGMTLDFDDYKGKSLNDAAICLRNL